MVCGGREQRNQVFLLMCNIYRSYIGILLQEMWHAPIKETIAISVKYYTVFPFSLSIAWLGSSVLHPFGTLKPFDPRWKPLSTLWAHNTAEVAGQCYMKDQTFHYHVTWTKMTFANIWSEMTLGNVQRLPLCSEHTLSTLRAQENNQGLLRASEREGAQERAQESTLCRDHYGRIVLEKTLERTREREYKRQH